MIFDPIHFASTEYIQKAFRTGDRSVICFLIFENKINLKCRLLHMKQLPVEIVQMISCYLEPSERKLLLNVSKDFYKIIILDIYKRNELIINIYKSPNFYI